MCWPLNRNREKDLKIFITKSLDLRLLSDYHQQYRDIKKKIRQNVNGLYLYFQFKLNNIRGVMLFGLYKQELSLILKVDNQKLNIILLPIIYQRFFGLNEEQGMNIDALEMLRDSQTAFSTFVWVSQKLFRNYQGIRNFTCVRFRFGIG